ncbi:MAG: hypothetical protein ACSLFB_09085 [Acidimicrobiales bacterium]
MYRADRDEGIRPGPTTDELAENRTLRKRLRWLACPITDAEWNEAQLANTIFDAHRDDPEFGYRFLADEARSADHAICDPDGMANLPGQPLVVSVWET